MGDLQLPYTLKQAAEAIGKSKPTVLRAIQAGRISATRNPANGGWLIEPAELHRIYATVHEAASETMRNGHDETALLTERVAEQAETIRDLRTRLDASEEERRALNQRLLTDQRPGRAWWRWRS